MANREPVAATAFDLTLPPELDEVISRAMAKDPDKRYQRGSEFAADLRRLQQIFDVGSTTTSLARLMGTDHGHASRGRALPGTHSVAEMAQAEKLVRNAIQTTPIRNLAVAAVALILLLIAGVQSKLLVISPKLGVNGLNVASSTPAAPGAERTQPTFRAGSRCTQCGPDCNRFPFGADSFCRV